MSLALAALSLRRALPRSFGVAVLVLAAALLATSPGPELDPAGALSRHGTWTALALALVPFVVHRAAATIARWRAGEIDWLAKSPAPRLGLVTSAACGIGAAVLATLLAIACVAELAAGARGGGAAERRVAATAVQGGAILDGREPVRWTVARPRGAERARVELQYVPLDVFADVEMRARDPRSGASRTTVAHVARPAAIEVELPDAGAGGGAIDSAEIELELRRIGGEGVALLAAPRIDWLGRVRSSRSASAALLAHAALAALAAAMLAFGLGAWMSPVLASVSTLSIALLGTLVGPRAAELWATSAFAGALDLAGRGLVPQAPGLATTAASTGVAAAGLALAWLGTRRWRTVT